jgi:hypothetical protein
MPRLNDELNEPKNTEVPKLSPRPRNGEKLKQTQFAATEAANATKGALIGAHKQQMQGLADSLDRAEQKRNQVLEAVSDRIVCLQDEGLFMQDLLSLVQQKRQPFPQSLAIDAFTETFDALDWELPSIAPSSVMATNHQPLTTNQ